MKNDINSVSHDEIDNQKVADMKIRFGLGEYGTIDLTGVKEFDIKRENSSSSFEFLMLDKKKV